MKFVARGVYLLLLIFLPIKLNACDGSLLKIKFNGLFKELNVELADTSSERKKGLMFRESLPNDFGMLFVYDRPQKVGFWMKNTLIPLDIAFANKRGQVIKLVRNTKPLSLKLIDGGENVQFVLEINAGMSEKINLFEGSVLLHPFIDKNTTEICN